MVTAAPPCGSLDIVFSFDTTGSMNRILDEVRGRLKDLIQRIQADIPGIRIAVFAHGDYCDAESTYVTKYIDFSTDLQKICEFVNDVEDTYGGDADECYELVLKEVREKLSWLPGSNKALVMIGDSAPHAPCYKMNKERISWKNETKALAKMGVKIYGVQCETENHKRATEFFETISQRTGGRHVQLKDFSNIFDLIMAICYREHGAEYLQAYEKEVRARDVDASTSADSVFGALKDGAVSPTLASTDTTDEPKLKRKGSKLIPCGARKDAKMKKVTVVKHPTAKKKVIQKSKKVVRKIECKFRENISEDSFVLKKEAWSPWKVVMSPKAPPKKMAKLWKKRRYGQGFRLKKLYNEPPRLSLYEIAEQDVSPGKKCVVRAIMSRRNFNLPNWESLLFGPYALRSSINHAIKSGRKVFIRRLRLDEKDREKTIEKLKTLKMYDYEWSSIHGLRITPRHMDM